MRIEEISLESTDIERPDRHPDLATYKTVTFRILPQVHPNSFVVPISVNLDQFTPEEISTQARFIFHQLIKSVAAATANWDRSGDPALSDTPASLNEGRLGPAADPAEGKR
jgi:hypothetical protein